MHRATGDFRKEKGRSGRSKVEEHQRESFWLQEIKSPWKCSLLSLNYTSGADAQPRGGPQAQWKHHRAGHALQTGCVICPERRIPPPLCDSGENLQLETIFFFPVRIHQLKLLLSCKEMPQPSERTSKSQPTHTCILDMDAFGKSSLPDLRWTQRT